MCSSKPKPPPVVVRDPVADAAKAANDAQRAANAQTATRRKKLRSNSLFTVGARGITGNPTFSAYAAAQGVTKSSNLGGT